MKTNNKTFSKKVKLIFTALLLMGGLTASAQITLPGGSDTVSDAPIDGFLSIGLIAGAAIGLRRYLKGQKSKM